MLGWLTFKTSLKFALTALSCLCIAKGAYIPAKALLAQELMERAWVKTQETGNITLPWSWMDAYPVARLHMPNEDTHIVLNTDSGQALAFGPALIEGTNFSGDSMAAIAAHKNTQFQSLKDIKTGDVIQVETASKQIIQYEVSHFEIIDTRIDGLEVKDANTLVLVTCYPFNAVTFNGPLRYAVTAKKVDDKAAFAT